MRDENVKFASDLEAMRSRMGVDIVLAEQIIQEAAIAAATARAANRFLEIVVNEQRRLMATVQGMLPPPVPQAQPPQLNGYDEHFYHDPMPKMFQQ